jgi:DNA-binding NarL/FixJ family response regulator
MTDAVTLQVMEAGASGIFLKHRDPDQLVTAIHRVRTRALNGQILADHSRSRIKLRLSSRQVAIHP